LIKVYNINVKCENDASFDSMTPTLEKTILSCL